MGDLIYEEGGIGLPAVERLKEQFEPIEMGYTEGVEIKVDHEDFDHIRLWE